MTAPTTQPTAEQLREWERKWNTSLISLIDATTLAYQAGHAAALAELRAGGVELPRATIETTAFSRDSSTQPYYTTNQVKDYGYRRAAAAAKPAPGVVGQMMEDGLKAIAKRLTHDYWQAGQQGCPPELKASNGELHTLRCKRCNKDSPDSKWCAETAVPQWTPASSPPLEADGEVLVLMQDGTCEIAWATYWHGSSTGFAQWTFRDPDMQDATPTHWMLLPQPPKDQTP